MRQSGCQALYLGGSRSGKSASRSSAAHPSCRRFCQCLTFPPPSTHLQLTSCSPSPGEPVPCLDPSCSASTCAVHALSSAFDQSCRCTQPALDCQRLRSDDAGPSCGGRYFFPLSLLVFLVSLVFFFFFFFFLSLLSFLFLCCSAQSHSVESSPLTRSILFYVVFPPPQYASPSSYGGRVAGSG